MKADQSKTERWIALYRDDGPSGPSGQMMSITSPWTRLYVYEREEDARAFLRYLQRDRIGRRNPRIEWIFSEEDGNLFDGPIVPEGDRV